MKRASVILLLTGGAMFAQSLRPEIGEPFTPGKTKRTVTVTKYAKHVLVKCDNGEEAVLYRRDLTKPTLSLVSVSETKKEGFTYTYQIANDKTAVEPINQFVFVLPMGAGTVNKYWPEGVAPGKSAEFTVTSSFGPGQTKAVVMNLDTIKEAAWLDQQSARPRLSAEAAEAVASTKVPVIEVDVIGPVVPPQSK